jgi:hypothetical protein
MPAWIPEFCLVAMKARRGDSGVSQGGSCLFELGEQSAAYDRNELLEAATNDR